MTRKTLLSGAVAYYRTYEKDVYWPHLKSGSVALTFLILQATRFNSYNQIQAFEREESLVHTNR